MIDQLPESLKGKLFDFLSWPDLARCGMTCRSFLLKVVGPSTTQLVDSNSEEEHACLIGRALAANLSHFCHLRYLVIKNCSTVREGDLFQGLSLLKMLETLQLYNLQVFSEESLPCIASSKATLRILHLCGCIVVLPDGIDEFLSSVCSPTLEEVVLGGFREMQSRHPTFVLSLCCQLQSLEVSRCNMLESLTFSNSASSVERLRISSCGSFQGFQGFESGLRPMMNLVSLNLELVPMEGDSICRAIGQLARLQSVHVSVCWGLAEFELAGHENLREISITCCESLVDVRLADLSCLRELNMYGNRNLRSVTVRRCVELKLLDLSMLTMLSSVTLTGLTNIESLNLCGCTELQSGEGLVMRSCSETVEIIQAPRFGTLLV